MTVTVSTKHEIAKTTEEDAPTNGTCHAEKQVSQQDHLPDHTDSLLENLAEDPQQQQQEQEQNGETAKNNNMDNQALEKKMRQFEKEASLDKMRRLFTIDEVPHYLRHNAYILSGYRGILNTKLCLESVFWWTNETINIWSHIFGFVLFLGLSINDLLYIDVDIPTGDKILVGTVLICFQVCMILSSLYHTFTCRSERDAHCFLLYDLFGIAISLYAIYVSGIYYAFWCDPTWQPFYVSSVTIMFVMAMALQLPRFKVSDNIKMFVFVAWAAYGVVPTIHWTVEMGGFQHPLVKLLVPRVLGMYAISGVAFVIYLTKIPERWCAGRFDYLGHSHQWWHIIVVFALYYWHDSGLLYLEYRLQHACSSYLRIA